MTLPADANTREELTPSAGLQAGASPPRGTYARLEPFLYQSMRWCARCAGEEIFVPVFECHAGRVGLCLGCGEEKLIPFSRMTEAA